MAQFYKILKAEPLGDPWTPKVEGGKPIQNFWCQLEGVDNDVSIGKQVPTTLTPGEQVYGDLMYAKSQKGTEYWKFKSAKVPDGVERPASTPAQAQAQQAVGDNIPAWFVPFGNILISLDKDMKLLKGDDIEGDIEQKPVDVEPKGVEQIGGEPLDKETKATIDAIFTPSEPEVPEGK